MSKTGIFMGSAALAIALALSAPALAQDIVFGDDSSTWANDGQCDDPRFQGPGAATVRSPVDLERDATDCRTAFEAGTVTLVETATAPAAPPAQTSSNTDGEIDFGDDSGSWANDGECDDPRFGGSLDSHRFADASDCRAAYEAGEVSYVGEIDGDGYPIVVDGIDFGYDDGEYAFDDECDDSRFTGTGMGASLDSHRYADATDCSQAYREGTVTLAENGSDDGGFRINFGDDSSASAQDGVCDDPRFQGRGAALELRDANILSDATDCRAAYEAGTVTYAP